MDLLIILTGGLALANCVCGILTGKMYYFFKAPDEFVGAVRTVSRADLPAAFWVFFTVTMAFGAFVMHFGYTKF